MAGYALRVREERLASAEQGLECCRLQLGRLYHGRLTPGRLVFGTTAAAVRWRARRRTQQAGKAQDEIGAVEHVQKAAIDPESLSRARKQGGSRRAAK